MFYSRKGRTSNAGVIVAIAAAFTLSIPPIPATPQPARKMVLASAKKSAGAVHRKSRLGPSAQAAARLKNSPPPGWIQHYLPDDRYKIAGGIWKFVSTENDAYVHRASCPNILNQAADGVLGFASADDVKEAGYEFDPACASAAAYERSWLQIEIARQKQVASTSPPANPEHESGFDWMVPKRSAASLARERKWAENRLRAQIMSRQTITGSSAFGSSTSTSSGSFRP